MAFKFKNRLLQAMNNFGDKIRRGFTKKKANVTPGMQDSHCKQSYYGKINRSVCKNNCNYYDKQKKKCKLGYKL